MEHVDHYTTNNICGNNFKIETRSCSISCMCQITANATGFQKVFEGHERMVSFTTTIGDCHH